MINGIDGRVSLTDKDYASPAFGTRKVLGDTGPKDMSSLHNSFSVIEYFKIFFETPMIR